MKIDVTSRRAVKVSPGGTSSPRLTGLESLAIAQFEPFNAEATRAGRRFLGGNNIIANGIAPVSAIPTTTATLALYNAEPDGTGKTYAIDSISFWLGSGTAAAGATLFYTVSPAAIATAPTAMATGYSVSSASGSSRTSNALFATAVTVPTTPAAPAWVAAISTFQLAAANVGQGDGYRELNGAVLVPPKRALCFGILSGTGTSPLYGISVTWTELDLDLE